MPSSRSESPPPPGVTPGAPSPEERIVKSAGWIFVAVFLGAPLIVLWFLGPAAPLWMLLIPQLVLSFGSSVWYLSIQNRQRKAIARAGFRVCLRCRYSLADLPDVGKCPECGQDYTLEGLKRSWSWTYAER